MLSYSTGVSGHGADVDKVALATKLVRQRRPEKLVEDAIRGMLPKTKLGDAMYRKLKVYKGTDHPHQAQRPETLTTKSEAR